MIVRQVVLVFVYYLDCDVLVWVCLFGSLFGCLVRLIVMYEYDKVLLGYVRYISVFFFLLVCYFVLCYYVLPFYVIVSGIYYYNWRLYVKYVGLEYCNMILNTYSFFFIDCQFIICISFV